MNYQRAINECGIAQSQLSITIFQSRLLEDRIRAGEIDLLPDYLAAMEIVMAARKSAHEAASLTDDLALADVVEFCERSPRQTAAIAAMQATLAALK